jgi:hypothetical protein
MQQISFFEVTEEMIKNLKSIPSVSHIGCKFLMNSPEVGYDSLFGKGNFSFVNISLVNESSPLSRHVGMHFKVVHHFQ